MINTGTPLHLRRFLREMDETPFEMEQELPPEDISDEEKQAQIDQMWDEHESALDPDDEEELDMFDDMLPDDDEFEGAGGNEDMDMDFDPRAEKTLDFRHSDGNRSNKDWKRMAHGRLRTAVRGGDLDATYKDISDPWTSDKEDEF